MTASMPTHSSSWDRVLPAPFALLNGRANEILPRRSSSLLQHHLASSKDCQAGPRDRRSTVPCISYNVKPPAPHVPPVDRRGSQAFSALDAPGLGPVTKKRAASLMAVEPNSRESSPVTGKPTSETNNQFCLCQPDPKIPRPRNAFILYRQHHQAAVVDKHPGLPNPEISKIIGEEWRALPPEIKNRWKSLAEDEKTRHQQQYPDYRYQPRRLGRNAPPQSALTIGAAGSAENCLRCGGKTMNLPETPRTPGFSPTGVSGSGVTRSQAVGSASISQAARRPRPLGHMGFHRQAPYAVPGSPPPTSAITRVRPFGEVYAGGAPPGAAEAEYRARYANHPMSPSPKRRRWNGPGVMVPARATEANSPAAAYPTGHPWSPATRSLASRGTEMSMYGVRHQSPTNAAHLQRANPPVQHTRYASVGTRDPSLTLAPLKTPSSATGSTGSSNQKEVNNSATAEAQIMSIPAINKLRLLAKAAPPLPHPGSMTAGPKSPAGTSAPQSRGAILAIEGSKEDVRMMTEWLAEFLKNESDGFQVHAFAGPDMSAVMAEANEEAETKVVGTQQQRYLRAIGEWHRVSQEVAKFITSTTTAAANSAASSEHSGRVGSIPSANSTEQGPGTSTTEPEAIDVDAASPSSGNSAISPHTITQTQRLGLKSPDIINDGQKQHQQQDNHSTTNSKPEPAPCSTTTPAPAPTTTRSFPIALIPRYQLSTVDTASLCMPITDSYLPIDHWQWAAALWRGCAGADVTIVIQDQTGSHAATPLSSAGPGGVAGTGATAEGGGNGNSNGNGGAGPGPGGVEVRLGTSDIRAVVVRKAIVNTTTTTTTTSKVTNGSGNASANSPKPSSASASAPTPTSAATTTTAAATSIIEPGQLRRVGFEIAEFLRR